MASHRGLEGAYGDLAERRAKMDSKYDPALEAALRSWMEAVVGQPIGGDSFQEGLKDGVFLAKLANKLQPGAVKMYQGGLAFKQMENISQFITWCSAYGVRSADVFQTPDLFEGVNMTAVQVCLDNVRRCAELKAQGKDVPAQKAAQSVMLAGVPAGRIKPESTKGARNDPLNKYTGPAENKSDGANQLYGDLAERQAKLDSKYDKALESELQKWIEGKTGQSIGGDFQAGLKNGKILCALANAIQPGAIPKVNDSGLAFKQMENIQFFLTWAQGLGVRADDLFQTVNLFEGSNMTQVLQTLDNVRRLS